ncbi:MAG: SH3 domain-containing protein [Clostridia bacterium]|nr:SH3 domain-containing protein [Clostridia bacterium]
MKKQMRRTALVSLIVLLLSIGRTYAEILPPHGEGQIGLEAEILCEELTLREKPSSSSRAVKSLKYGDLLLVVKQSGNWAYCALGDSEDALVGWVNADYIAIDPSWYRAEAKTTVYAWNDTAAPKVALLDKGTTLTILKEEGNWLLVSLRGAVGWIHK